MTFGGGLFTQFFFVFFAPAAADDDDDVDVDNKLGMTLS